MPRSRKAARARALDDAEATQVIRKQVKQRQDSIESFEKGGRPELAAKEKDELAILNAYLPQAMDAKELENAVRDAIAETGATSRAQMGAVMKVLQTKLAGRADGKTLESGSAAAVGMKAVKRVKRVTLLQRLCVLTFSAHDPTL